MTFAVIKAGGKQYRVSPGQKLRIEKLVANEGANVRFDEVLLISNGDSLEIGTPMISGAHVAAKVLRQARERKKIVFKYHSKSCYQKKHGHRQPFTEVEIQAINR